MRDAFVSDPLVKIKADIMAAEHWVSEGRDELAEIALARIERQLPNLHTPQLWDIMSRLQDAGLAEAEYAA